MSEVGTTRTSPHVRVMSALERTPDIGRLISDGRDWTILDVTALRHMFVQAVAAYMAAGCPILIDPPIGRLDVPGPG